MPTLQITARIDDARVLAAFHRLGHLATHAKPMFAEIGMAMLITTEARFSAQVDPAGNAWAPLATSTRKRKRHPKILTESGRLRSSITYRATDGQVEVGTNMVYAAIHQLGGRAGKKRAALIPPRPFLGVSAEDAVEINATVADFIRRSLEP